MSCRSVSVSRAIIAVSFLAVPPAAAQPSIISSGATTEVGGLVEGSDTAIVPQTPWGHPDLQGVWNTSTTTPLERMTDEERERSRLPSEAAAAVTAATSAAWLERAGGLDRNSWERCISLTLPIAMMPIFYNANYQILQTPTHVAIVMEMIHEARIVPLMGGDMPTAASASGSVTHAVTGTATPW